jgi:hypothetical protein
MYKAKLMPISIFPVVWGFGEGEAEQYANTTDRKGIKKQESHARAALGIENH